MTTLTITLPDEVAARLADLAREDGRDPAALAGDALREYLAERAEDEEDARIAAERMANPNTRFYSSDETRQLLGIDKKGGKKE